MEIRLARLPFKFQTPDGMMEVTVRGGTRPGSIEPQTVFAAAASFIQHGPRALERIQLTPNMPTYGQALKALTTGFKVTPSSHEPDSLKFRVLTALTRADGVLSAQD